MHLQLVGVALDQVVERVVIAGSSPSDQVRCVHVSSQFIFPRGAFGSLSALWQRESLFDEQGLLRVRGMIAER